LRGRETHRCATTPRRRHKNSQGHRRGPRRLDGSEQRANWRTSGGRRPGSGETATGVASLRTVETDAICPLVRPPPQSGVVRTARATRRKRKESSDESGDDGVWQAVARGGRFLVRGEEGRVGKAGVSVGGGSRCRGQRHGSTWSHRKGSEGKSVVAVTSGAVGRAGGGSRMGKALAVVKIAATSSRQHCSRAHRDCFLVFWVSCKLGDRRRKQKKSHLTRMRRLRRLAAGRRCTATPQRRRSPSR